MYVDFTDLNRAYPKDSYPFPNIDKLVNVAAGYEYLSFMDAYSECNQIRMHPKDEEKTAIMTNELSCYYKVMLLRLKNARLYTRDLQTKYL